MNILVLCTGNSARSLIAEGLFRSLGAGKLSAFSAGSKPTGQPNPAAMAVLQAHNIATDFARSKSWDEFAMADSPEMDVIITVCGNAKDETCPVWLGHPFTAHWGVEDPADVTAPAEAVEAAFQKTYAQMARRIKAFLDLPSQEAMGEAHWRAAVRAIGDIDDAR